MIPKKLPGKFQEGRRPGFKSSENRRFRRRHGVEQPSSYKPDRKRYALGILIYILFGIAVFSLIFFGFH